MLKHNLQLLTWIAFGFRVIFLLAIPNLSQDFYRFIWDGRLILENINPYLHPVEYYIKSGISPIAQAQELYNGMGVLNGSHYSNYTPVNQLLFALAAILGGKTIIGSVMAMRIFIIAADFGTLYFGKKLLEGLKIPVYNIFFYILNPFIIIELTGNLHFEGVMIFFLVWSLHLLFQEKWKLAALVLALSISVKLIPLIFLPLYFQWFTKHKKWSYWNGIKKLMLFYFIVFAVVLSSFITFYFSGFTNIYLDTVGLWFQRFEFNASLYYLAREIGYAISGYNKITAIGKGIIGIVFIAVLAMAFLRKSKTIPQLITTMLLALSFYYFTATTMHPWYISSLLLLSVYTNYKFPLIWSFTVILSYLAYNNTNNSENFWVLVLEYAIVYGVFIWEVFIKKTTKKVA
ncbi:glycosyltransferase 87 family protein [Marixanthotalea marina]|uniref:glycosyltransferase 87 family protein n=1 Tax=Marixanthotalea marina TaxID=2844359 RepID=UPI002989E1E9|nr:glycosyltransferase 87 family protein [Marixanthotalea marina]